MAMIYLVHHGDAVGPEVDPARPLSTRGRAEVDLLAQQAADRGVKPAVIWHSGKLRAKQTAEAFWRRCNPLSTFAATRGLQPADPASWMVDALVAEMRALRQPQDAPSEHSESRSDIMLVGHFPYLPRLLAVLLSGNPEAEPVDFPMNGIVAIEDAGGRWKERWRLERP